MHHAGCFSVTCIYIMCMQYRCSVCRCDIPSDYLTPEIKECQKLLIGKALTPPKKSNGM